ncbi:right-handed parallel beta-helix repeat-containing protein [Lysinibacillus antri]|uniref:Copper-binding protein n=1 Tax=Lysinibacillus antri TaxID=2498145 RepID=A0A432LAP6_9BACI|nr:NosD domain-containing protein [Lysinibacillus antri]RUL51718.1 copper-binding protein [Lysinibacillus antri]
MKIWLGVLVAVSSYLLDMSLISANSNDLQSLIDATEEGGVLTLQEGEYKGNFLIQKSMVIIANGHVVITSEQVNEPLFRIEDSQNVSLKGLELISSGTAIKVNRVKNIELSNLVLHKVFSGIEVYDSKNVEINHVSVNGKGHHPSNSGNGIAIFTSTDITVENSHMNGVQDGVYIEGVKNIIVTGNEVVNSRYGNHFMYSENATIVNNRFTKNVTGLMIMMANEIYVESNDISDQDGFNGTGITLYDTKVVEVQNNTIAGNKIGLTIQKTANVRALSNTFQMNQTAVESTNSENSNLLANNVFIGNIVNCRTDEIGLNLKNNYYDDYTGIDIDGDGIGDEPYVALQSFGQWMVRKPVYQYYVESPSVVLLNQLDQQANRGSQTLLVDQSPLTNKNIKQYKEWHLNHWQLSIGIALLVLCLIIWRRSVLT